MSQLCALLCEIKETITHGLESMLLTADEAKEIMQRSYDDVMTEASNRIQEAAENGKDCVYVSAKSHEFSEKLELRLQELGYTVILSEHNTLLVMW